MDFTARPKQRKSGRPTRQVLPVLSPVALLRRPIVALVAAILVIVSACFYGFTALGRVSISGPVYARVTLARDLVADVLPPAGCILEAQIHMLRLLDETDSLKQLALLNQISNLRETFHARYREWAISLPDGPLRDELYFSAYPPAARYFETIHEELGPLVLAGERAEALSVAAVMLRPYYDMHRSAIDNVVVLAREHNRTLEMQARSLEWRTYAILAVALIFAALCLGLFGMNLLREKGLRKRAESELLRTNELLEKTLSGMYDAVVVTDESARAILYANRAACSLFGVERLVDISVATLFESSQISADCLGALLGGIQSGGFYTGSCRMRTSGGRTFPADVSASAIREDGQQVKSLVLIVRDTSARETLRLNEAALHQAQRLEAIGTLAGGIAHDFNNVLTPIMGYTELIRRQLPDTDAPARHYTGQILIAAERARDLVLQILSFARERSMERVPVNLASQVSENLKLLRATLPSTIHLEFIDEGGGVCVLANPSQMHQLVMNMATNASHAMRLKGGTLTISIERSTSLPSGMHAAPSATGWIVMRFRDTGHGIPSAIIDRIFDPFFTTKGPGEGTGMGLSVVHGIVRSCNGAIKVDSDEGKGSTFTICLPVHHAPVSTTRKQSTRQMEVRGNGQRVLFVDDEPAIVKLFTAIISDLGYTIDAYNRADDALEAFRSQPDSFDLLMTDQTMPGMTGIELISRARALRPALPAILCTGYSDIFGAEDAARLGVNKFILKPINRLELASAIAELTVPVTSRNADAVGKEVTTAI